MKLRFDVDQAAAFQAGVDAPRSFHVLEVDPKTLSLPQRQLIAARLRGIDVCSLADPTRRIMSRALDIYALLAAVEADELGWG